MSAPHRVFEEAQADGSPYRNRGAAPPDAARRHWLKALLGVALARRATAQSPLDGSAFPDRPITIYCPWTAGGPTDIALRALADALGRMIGGKRIIVENKPGAGGALGAQTMAATAKPDGYTIAQTPLGVFRLPHMIMTAFNPITDLTWILCVAGYQFGVTVRADSPWKTWQELVTHAKANPGRVGYASPGIGTSLHITMEDIGQREGIQWLHVPFKGSADAYAALRGGQVACQAGTPPWEAVDAGQMRVLTTWSASRNPRAPNVPTLQEIYGIVANSPWGIAGPRGMDARVVRFLHDHLRRAMDDPQFLATLARTGQEPNYMSSDEYQSLARAAFEAEREVVRRLGLKL